MKNKSFKKFLFSTMVLFLTGSINALGQETFNYVVKSGDSLWKICVKYEVGASDILALNPNITDPNSIYPNTTIKIPNLSEVKKLENEVIRLVNVERSKIGVGQLKANWQLSRVARYKSQDMINKKYFSHTSPTYGSPFDMMRNFGINYRSAGENIAYGQNSPSEVMKSWMNSPGHKQNILNSTYTEIGVGVARASNGQLYWTQMFIGR